MSSATLERNLAALRRTSPAAAQAIAQAASRPDLVMLPTDEGVPSAAVIEDSGSRLLASRRRPLDEAARLADAVDVEQSAAFVVLGFGLGYHCRALARRLERTGVIACFEPDVPLLRAVFEEVDHSDWIAATHFALFTDPEDAAGIAAAMNGLEGLLALGVKVLEHPPSRARLGAPAARFSDTFTKVMRAVRTSVVTTLVQMETTLRNLLMNADRYATAPGITDLRGAAAGRPAIVVSAGPSLARNIDLLVQPGVRDRFVIIAVQTVLKTLLARGIRPHFVTALDYHEISRRFYEGLSSADVEGVTLVAEPKANPAILEAFPGALRMPQEPILDEIIGPRLARDMGRLTPGATVAHLAYYLARHLGCDPVSFIGQDLGFTDGQYYAPGAAIHQVWSAELNPFNTLEMLEWQRIARARRTLVRAIDHLGRPVYTDEQMHTYLVQFERDFLADAARGLRVIDATEGGVAKRHAQAMPLRDVIAQFGSAGEVALPAADPLPSGPRLAALTERLGQLRGGVWSVGECSREAASLLEKIQKAADDPARVNRLIADVHKVNERVHRHADAFTLVQHLNQTGTLNRVRADRRLHLAKGLKPAQVQARQVERDLVNVRWLADASDQMGRMLDDAVRCLKGAPKHTRDRSPRPEIDADDRAAATAPSKRIIHALIAVDPERGGLATPRDLSRDFAAGLNPLRLLLARLARCRRLDGVTLIARDEPAARALAGPIPPGLKLNVVRADADPFGERRSALAAARLWAAECWRGGLANVTCYDEILAAPAMARAMEAAGLDAAVVLGCDWALADPAIIDALVERHLERPDRFRVVFSQAPPGLAGVLIDRVVMRDVAAQQDRAGALGTLGAVFGYVPVAPQVDPIGTPSCVAVLPAVRDLGLRCIPDTDPVHRLLGAAITADDADPLSIDAPSLARRLADRPRGSILPPPQRLTLELCTGRRASGLRGEWLRRFGEPLERVPMSPAIAERLVAELAGARSDLAVTLAGAGDPLVHPDWERFVSAAKRHGAAAVHIRTDLLCDEDTVDRLAACGADVISVDVMAEQPDTYRALMGIDALTQARQNLERLLGRRQISGGLPTPWVVPRITRCDAVYAEIENFYNRWLALAGAAVIDPLPSAIRGQRIQSLPRPADAARRMLRAGVLVLSDGSITADEGDIFAERTLGNAAAGVLPAWRRAIEAAAPRRVDRDDQPADPAAPPRISPARAKFAA